MIRFIRLSLVCIVFLGAVWAASIGCTGVTNSKARLRVMTHLYFDPETGKYPSLDDNIFGLKTRLTGILNPRKFAEVFGFWVFLSEPHKPKRIPVLMVHGHLTGPPAFKKLAENLDRTRYEPWFTYYPTGLSLPESANMLRLNLGRLCKYYGQREVAVIAFSMGGLVMRQAMKPDPQSPPLPKVPMFIGISNPWGGSPKTRAGTRFSFSGKKGSRLALAESWDEFVDQTPFINTLFDSPLPKETTFHMIYSVGGNDDFLEGRDDGALPESSLGRIEAVNEAESVTIFEEPVHSTVIYDDRTIAKVNELLGRL